MSAVNSEQRRLLERVVGEARDAAETAARAALKRLAVDQDDPFGTMSPADRALRNLLRAESRRLGETVAKGFEALVTEVAYQHWHRMLFARFLAENDLLMVEGMDVAVTLEECADIAQEIGEPDAWAVACRYAAAMLPGVFRTGDPVLQVRFATEGRLALEQLLNSLHAPIFKADDSLGWVYQFWQAKAKAEVNASGRKVGGADISPVTQLFTEHYMVQFLLHNSLGAWWAGKHPGEALPTDLDYLRRLDDGSPAAGTFSGWPATAKELKILDPSCGSGHFLVAAFSLMVRFRMAEEGLSASDAGDAVLRDNLFGLELDPRCTQIAAFALALTAWKHGGYRNLPLPNVACSGIRLGGTAEDWRKLAGKDGLMQAVLAQVRELFAQAPDLGSLLDPSSIGQSLAPRHRAATPSASAPGAALQMGLLPSATPTLWEGAGESGDDWASNGRMSPLVAMEQLLPKLSEAAERFGEDGDDAPIFGEAAKQAVRAVGLLAGKYHLVITNVPYLGRTNQGSILRAFFAAHFPRSKSDLATVFMERCLQFCTPGGSTALVMPQNWLFLGAYSSLRSDLLKKKTWDFVARLGFGAFSTPMFDFNVMMGVWTNATPKPEQVLIGLDASDKRIEAGKEGLLRTLPLQTVVQTLQLSNPDARITLEEMSRVTPLASYANCLAGLNGADITRFTRSFWELSQVTKNWEFLQNSFVNDATYTGMSDIVLWEEGKGSYYKLVAAKLGESGVGAWIRGAGAWGRRGIAVVKMGSLSTTLYMGNKYGANIYVIVPKDEANLPAIFSFTRSSDFLKSCRALDQKLDIANHTILKVPFDLDHWQKVADETYPDGLPEPYSDDPTQWLFDGHPAHAKGEQGQPGDAFQIAVARLLGYRWPRQTGAEIPGCHLLPDDGFDAYADTDGIVCLPPVAGEASAAERLRTLLAAAFGDKNGQTATHATIERLLAEAGYGGKTLDDWLRDGFFAQHIKRFHNRPFLWHIWDGRKDGFSAIVNYHKLDRAKLEKLTYTYLGDWINRQIEADRNNVPGANARLVAAKELQQKLEAILEGEPPYDIYVRWKPLAGQPLGWEPDLNDGVRLNIRPFVEAEVLRVKKPSINWNKDRGTNPDGSERHNDLHITPAEKRAAQAEGK